MFKHRQMLRIKDEHMDDFLTDAAWPGRVVNFFPDRTPEEIAKDKKFYTRENEWEFQYQEDDGKLVVWHTYGDDTEIMLDPSWVECIDKDAPEYYDHAEARGC